MRRAGELEHDYQSFAWDDWDEDCHGPQDSVENQEQYPHGIMWTCCEESGEALGCTKGKHESHSQRSKKGCGSSPAQRKRRKPTTMTTTMTTRRTNPRTMTRKRPSRWNHQVRTLKRKQDTSIKRNSYHCRERSHACPFQRPIHSPNSLRMDVCASRGSNTMGPAWSKKRSSRYNNEKERIPRLIPVALPVYSIRLVMTSTNSLPCFSPAHLDYIHPRPRISQTDFARRGIVLWRMRPGRDNELVI